MYDINTKNVRSGLGFYFIFLFLGLVFLVPMTIAFFVPKKEPVSIYDTKAKIRAVEIETVGNTTDVPVYYYDVDGVQYRCAVHENFGIEPSLDDIVYYNSFNPSSCTVKFEEKKKTNNWEVLLFIIITPTVFVIYALFGMFGIFKRLLEIRHLNKKGKLVKNLPYRLKKSNMTFNDVVLKCPIICYILPSGDTVMLRGDARFDKKLSDADGCVDLVIDEKDPSKYFIDFEINRKGGNLPQDFCDQEKYKQFFEKNNNVINPYNDRGNVVNQYNNPYND